MSDHFIGMTKATFTRVLVAALLVMIGLQVYTLWEAQGLARRADQAHTSLCALRKDNLDTLHATIRARQHFHPGPGEGKLLDLLIQARERTAQALDYLDGGC